MRAAGDFGSSASYQPYDGGQGRRGYHPVRAALAKQKQRLQDPQAGGADGFGGEWLAAAAGGPAGSQLLYGNEARSEDADAEDDAEESVLTNLHANLYSSAFLLTMRGWLEGRRCSSIMAWIWVVLAYLVQGFFTYTAYAYVAYRLELDYFEDVDGVRAATHHLTQVIEANISLRGNSYERQITSMCRRLPSPSFFCAVEFIFNCFQLSSMSELRTLLFQVWMSPIVRSRRHTVEEYDSKTVVVGILPRDRWVFVVGLVVPKMVMTVALWYIGTALVAFTRQMRRMVFRALILVFISKMDAVLFSSFLSSSKKDWLAKSQVLMVSRPCVRYGTAWPGELLKLVAMLLLVMVSYILFRHEFLLRTLCWSCARDCTRRCSESFMYCKADQPQFWPWLHHVQ